MRVSTIQITPFSDQKPGTSGLRKKVSVFQQPHYLESFVQAIFNTLPMAGKTLILGGDGRYFNQKAIQIIIRMAAASGVSRLWVGKEGLLSTPAASMLIRQYQAFGGIILSASHNPGGIDGDFGIKFNMHHGGPAPESITEHFYANSRILTQYTIAENAEIDLSILGCHTVGKMRVEVIDSVQDYTRCMEQLFDFNAIRQWFIQGHTLQFDAMHAVAGPYAQYIFETVLGAPVGSVINAIPKEDFAGQHPDPNPAHASQLVRCLFGENAPDLGAASDGDADRNMIVGQGIIVTPSDSLAILAAHAHRIPGYQQGLKGIARSMPTSCAVDAVAKKLGLASYETPTGWKFFSNLLEAGHITLCGEESYGTGSNHIREKDGIWAVLYWLNILASTGKSVLQLVEEHWAQFGRHYYSRHDFEAIPLSAAEAVMQHLRSHIVTLNEHILPNFHMADEFSYVDPVDGTYTAQQGIRILFKNGARIIYRLSGTGTQGATLRIYLERYVKDTTHMTQPVQSMLAELITLSQKLAHLTALTGRQAPTVVV
jgi:phosphoglucomutase